MNAWELPTSLNVGGVDWNIRTDFRAILDISKYFSDHEYEDYEKWEICLTILYEDYEKMSFDLKEEAIQKAIDFIGMGIKDDRIKRPVVMDWSQDATVIIPSINRVLNTEVRSVHYLHWWTFLGAYMEIGDSLFSQIVGVRTKKAKGEKLEKWEKDFYKENKQLIDFQRNKHKRNKEEEDALRELFGR